MSKKEKTSDHLMSVDIDPKLRQKSAPPPKGRHEQFQFGTNPMSMSSFEKSRIELEIKEREDATKKYVKGIQGVDGGCWENAQVKREATEPYNVKEYT